VNKIAGLPEGDVDMSERKPSPLLDPYCPHCNEYKGVGLCKNDTCHSIVSDEEGISQGGVSAIQTCQKCDGTAQVTCSRCGNGFCEEHSIGKEKEDFFDFSLLIGTCIICSSYVCERCWIINDQDNIECVIHHESSKE
jgi:hypothetical protein